MHGPRRFLRVRIRATNEAQRVRDGLAWRPLIVRRWTAGIGDVATTAGLRQRDVFFLAGVNWTEQPEFHSPAMLRAVLQRLARVRTMMRRLEGQGYVEPGWSVGDGDVECVLTESGERAGRAARQALGLQPYPGEPVRRHWWQR